MKQTDDTKKVTIEGRSRGSENNTEKEIVRLRGALNFLMGYALTSRSHSQEWLKGLAAKINHAADVLGDSDRAEVRGDGLVIIRRGN